MAYVHWQGRSKRGQIIFWSAVLVKNVRVRGTPTKQHVVYIAGISPERAEDTEHRARFWEKALAELDALDEGQLPRKSRPKIEAALAERVPRPANTVLQRVRRLRATRPLDPQEVHEREFDLEEESERGF